MAEERTQRRLAAIVAADVAGYSRLMEQDEAATLAVLKQRRREILQPLLAEYDGRIVKVMGDGVLVEFASAVMAVACAVELQKHMAAANDGVAHDRHILLRIGINLGDVVVEGGDLYGDGVNVAARLQALAEPGDICISAKVHDEVGRKLDIGFEDVGERRLKNVTVPVQVYRVRGAPLPRSSVLGPPTLLDRPSIAVLPFDNLSGDPAQQYFSDGITEDIITELSRFHGISVLARHASFRFRGTRIDINRVREELGAAYIVEGSVRRLGNRFRIAAQLIDASTGKHLWAERFDRDQHEIFAVQDQVVRTIVGTIAGRVEASGVEHARRKPPANLMAYDYVLRGNALPVGDVAAEAEARRMYEKAIELDPTYGLAYGLLAYVISLERLRDKTTAPAAFDQALELAMKGVQCDDTSSDCHTVLGWVHLNRRDFDLAERCYMQAIDLNPNNPLCIAGLAEWLNYVGRPEEALAVFKQVKQINPHFNPAWWWRTLGVVHFNARQYDLSVADFSRASSNEVWSLCYIAACHGYLARSESAAELVAEILRLAPDFSSRWLLAKEPYKRVADQEHLLKGLRKAGLPD